MKLLVLTILIFAVFSEEFQCDGLPATDPLVCSGNGECVLEDTCECEGEWGSDFCDVKLCHGYLPDDEHVCHGHGGCNVNGTCVCDVDFTGDDCAHHYLEDLFLAITFGVCFVGLIVLLALFLFYEFKLKKKVNKVKNNMKGFLGGKTKSHNQV